MGRPRKFKTVAEMEEAWEAYKEYCDNYSVLTHEFSAKNSEFVSAALKKSITYTIEGFCVYCKMARSTFYQIYAEDKKFSDIVTRMRDECEADARQKFEVGAIPTQLAALWMSKYGYATKQDTGVSIKEAEKSKLDALLDEMQRGD